MQERGTSADTHNRKQRRQAILAVAKTMILAKGIAGTPMKALADAAGVARKTLYRYFANIEQVAQELLAEITASPDFFGMAQIVRGKNGYETFRKTCLAYGDYCLANIDVIKFYYEYDYHFREPSNMEIHAFWKNRPHVFQILLEEGIADGSIRISPQEAHAVSLVVDNAILAVTQKLVLREKVYELECNFTRRELGKLTELLLDGLAYRRVGEGASAAQA